MCVFLRGPNVFFSIVSCHYLSCLMLENRPRMVIMMMVMVVVELVVIMNVRAGGVRAAEGDGTQHLTRCIRMAEPLFRSPDYIFPITTRDIEVVCKYVWCSNRLISLIPSFLPTTHSFIFILLYSFIFQPFLCLIHPRPSLVHSFFDSDSILFSLIKSIHHALFYHTINLEHSPHSLPHILTHTQSITHWPHPFH